MDRQNALARMMALSMLLLRGLAKTAEGGSAGHAPPRARIWFSPRSESGARSKFDVYGGLRNFAARTGARRPAVAARRPPRRRGRRGPPPAPRTPTLGASAGPPAQKAHTPRR